MENESSISLGGTFLTLNNIVETTPSTQSEPYTLVGPPVKRPVLALLAVYYSTTAYICVMMTEI